MQTSRLAHDCSAARQPTPRGIIGERRRGMVGTCTAHWTLLTRGMAFIVGFLLLLGVGMGSAADGDIAPRIVAVQWVVFAR